MSGVIREDKARMQAFYTDIAAAVAGCLPEGWTQLCVGFFVARDGEETYCVYYSVDGGQNYTDALAEMVERDAIFEMDGLFEGKEQCQRLRDYCVAMKDAWTQLTLAVNARGEFRADFGYEVFDSFDAFRIRQWKGNYLYN